MNRLTPKERIESTMSCKGDIQLGTACRKCERCLELGWGKRVLRLTLKRKWFDMIASGDKLEEYRTPGKWILSRLEGKEYDIVEFKNGYGANAPIMEVQYLGWRIGFGQLQWGAGFDELVVIRLGRVLYINNCMRKAIHT